MKTIKIKMGINGELSVQGLESINQYTFYDGLVDVYVPSSILATTSTCGLSFSNIDRDGSIHTETRPLLFVKSGVYLNNDSVEYTLYEIKIPKILTMYSGNQTFAVYVETLDETGATIVSRTTSSNYTYYVATSGDVSDAEEANDLSQLISKVNELLDTKQDKEDSNISVKLAEGGTTSNVVNALNSLGGRTYSLEETSKDHEERITTNETNIESNDQDIENLQGRTSTLENTTTNHTKDITGLDERISKVESEISSYFHFLGSFTYEHSGEPTTEELDSFVYKKESMKHIGDSILAISTYGEQDTLYMCIWTTEWLITQVEGIQRADNENYGVLKGNDKVSIVGGVVSSINVIYNGEAISIDKFYSNYVNTINSLSSSLTQEIERAKAKEEELVAKDKELQTNIDNVETTIRSEYKASDKELQTQIDTKASLNDLYDYALPRAFNDVNYINYSDSTIGTENVESTRLNSYATGQTDIGTFTLENNEYYYQLSRRNNIMVRLPYYNYTATSGTVKITLNVYINSVVEGGIKSTQLCSYTQDVAITNDNDMHTIEIDTTLNSLGNDAINVEKGNYYTYELFITNNTSETFLLVFANNVLYTSTVQFTVAQDPIVNLNFIDVVDEVLILEKQGSVEDETLYL